MSNEQSDAWSKLTDAQKKELGILVAKAWVDLQKKMHQEILDDLFTPFWVKWGRKLKNKIQGGKK
jgi:hypothetical protein